MCQDYFFPYPAGCSFLQLRASVTLFSGPVVPTLPSHSHPHSAWGVFVYLACRVWGELWIMVACCSWLGTQWRLKVVISSAGSAQRHSHGGRAFLLYLPFPPLVPKLCLRSPVYVGQERDTCPSPRWFIAWVVGVTLQVKLRVLGDQESRECPPLQCQCVEHEKGLCQYTHPIKHLTLLSPQRGATPFVRVPPHPAGVSYYCSFCLCGFACL